jgi:hypothetical protein
MNSSSFPPTPRVVSTAFAMDAAIAITSVNGWLAVRVPSVATTFAEYVPDGVVDAVVKERVPPDPPVAGTNCEVTPLGKLLAVTDNEPAELAPLTVTPTVPGVPS